MLIGGFISAYPPTPTPRMPISSMTHHPSFSRFCIEPTMLKAPSTSIAAAKNIDSTRSAMPGLAKATTPNRREARPPIRNTHQVRLHSALASAAIVPASPLVCATEPPLRFDAPYHWTSDLRNFRPCPEPHHRPPRRAPRRGRYAPCAASYPAPGG